MQLRIEDDPIRGFAGLEGEIDMATAPQLEAVLTRIPTSGPMTLDFSGVTFMDSSGIAVLVSTANRLADGSMIRIVGASPTILRILQICGLDRHPRLEIAN